MRSLGEIVSFVKIEDASDIYENVRKGFKLIGVQSAHLV